MMIFLRRCQSGTPGTRNGGFNSSPWAGGGENEERTNERIGYINT